MMFRSASYLDKYTPITSGALFFWGYLSGSCQTFSKILFPLYAESCHSFFEAHGSSNLVPSFISAGKICDAVEVAGKNVMSTSSTVTTELVDHKYCFFNLL